MSILAFYFPIPLDMFFRSWYIYDRWTVRGTTHRGATTMTAADEARAAWARKAEETEQERREAKDLIWHEAQLVRDAWQAHTTAGRTS